MALNLNSDNARLFTKLMQEKRLQMIQRSNFLLRKLGQTLNNPIYIYIYVFNKLKTLSVCLYDCVGSRRDIPIEISKTIALYILHVNTNM